MTKAMTTGLISDLYDPSGKSVEELIKDYEELTRDFNSIGIKEISPSRHAADDSIIYGVIRNRRP